MSRELEHTASQEEDTRRQRKGLHNRQRRSHVWSHNWSCTQPKTRLEPTAFIQHVTYDPLQVRRVSRRQNSKGTAHL